MDVRADGPHEVGSLVFLSASGDWTLTVVAKATFQLAPDVSPLLATGGDPLMIADVPWDDDPQWSLRASADLVPFKRSPEILVTGSAFAPAGKSVRAAMVRVTVGSVDKSLEVQGDSCFHPDGSLSEAAPWTRMPLVWERAAGGPGTVNPAGIPTGRAAYPDAWGRIFLPNLWPPWTSVSEPGESIEPVGLGPYSADWPERIGHLRTELAWDRPLPADFDGAYFNAAPLDQRVAELTGAETIALEHLHPRWPRLVTRLAPAAPIGIVEAPGVAPFTLAFGCDTLWIDSDRGIATLTFRAHAILQDPEQPGTIVVRALQDTRSPAALDSLAPPPPDNRSPPAQEAPRGRRETVEIVLPTAPQPSGGRRETAEIVVPTAPQPSGGRRETVEIVLPTAPQLSGGRRETVEIVVPPTAPSETWGFGGLLPPSATPAGQGDTLGERLVAAQVTLAQTVLGGRPGAGERPADEAFVPPPTEASEPVQPPPLWRGTPESAGTSDSATEESSALQETPPVLGAPEGPPPLPVEVYPLARCAAVAASLDARPAEAPAILAKESLDEDAWDQLRAHWDAAIEKDLARQKNKLLREFDAAYVARLEDERGPIAAGDYARLAAAAEVAETGPALEDLRIPPEAWPRIRRVWIQLLAKDKKLAALVQGFIEDERSR